MVQRGAIFLTIAVAATLGVALAFSGGDAATERLVQKEMPAETAAAQPELGSASLVPPVPGVAPAPKTRGLSARTAQSYSNKCRVPDGSICYVQAQPVGSSCTCPGNQSGIIVW